MSDGASGPLLVQRDVFLHDIVAVDEMLAKRSHAVEAPIITCDQRILSHDTLLSK